MIAGHEPAVAPEPQVRVQLAPDRRVVAPGASGRLTLVVDNHGRRPRAIQLQLGGPMSRYCRPRLCTVELLPGEQREIPIEVIPLGTGPEGGHEYELTVTASDLSDGTFLDRSRARLAVERRPALKARSIGRQRTVDNDQVTLKFVAYNSGNVELRVEVHAVDSYWWVRDTRWQRSRDRALSIRNGIDSVLGHPVAAEHIRPGEHWTVELPAVAPRYPVGLGARQWLIPVGVQSQGWAPECVFVELEQLPRTVLPVRVAALGAAVLVALLVVVALLVWLAT
jgi:hypothetical protein